MDAEKRGGGKRQNAKTGKEGKLPEKLP